MATSRQEQALRRREQLLDAALEVFSEKGVDGASVKDIAAVAQVTPGLLYHYFDGKEALIRALFEERGFLPRLRELLVAADTRPVTEVLPELGRAFDRVLADNAKLVALFFAAGHTNEQARVALRQFMSEGQQLLADYLQSRVEAGELRPHPTATAAATLFSTLAIGRRTGLPVDAADLVDLLLTGLIPRTARTNRPTETQEP